MTQQVNGFMVKLHNRRVCVGRMPNGDFWFKFRKLTDGKIKDTHLRLTNEATWAMIDCLRTVIEKEEKKANEAKPHQA